MMNLATTSVPKFSVILILNKINISNLNNIQCLNSKLRLFIHLMSIRLFYMRIKNIIPDIKRCIKMLKL